MNPITVHRGRRARAERSLGSVRRGRSAGRAAGRTRLVETPEALEEEEAQDRTDDRVGCEDNHLRRSTSPVM